MFYRLISLVLVAVLLHGGVAAQDQPQSPRQTLAKMQQVLHSAQQKNKAVRITLSKTIDNKTKLVGKVSEVSDTSFTVTDQKTGNPTKLVYEDVREVKQKGMSKGSRIALGIGIGAAAFIAVGVIVCYASGPCRD
jgi:hypothetical protein